MFFEIFVNYIPEWFNALRTTLLLAGSALLLGIMLAMFFTWLRFQNIRILNYPIEAIVFFIRGTPLLIQIFLIYYGTSQFAIIRETLLWQIFKEPFACATLALAINSAAYTSELFLGFLKNLPKGWLESGYVLGMSNWQAFKYLLMPYILRISLPAYSNEVIIILKSTSLASTITLLELTGMTRELIAITNDSLTGLLISGTFYLICNSIIMAIFKKLEVHYSI